LWVFILISFRAPTHPVTKRVLLKGAMNVKQSLKLALLLVPMLATWAFAGIYYEQELKTATQTMKTVCYISGPKMRVEMQGPMGNAVSIQRYDQGKMYQLYPNNKMYMEMPVPKPGPEVEAQLQVTTTKTDETKKVGDYNCTRYDVTVKGAPNMPPEGITTQYWTTTDVDVADDWTKFSDAQARSQSTKQAAEMAKVKGFPIQVEMTSPAGKMTMTVTTVKKQDVPDSMFEVPADYQKMAMPTAPPAAAPSAPAPAAPAPVAPAPQGGAGQ
jgi:hypothetical protein